MKVDNINLSSKIMTYKAFLILWIFTSSKYLTSSLRLLFSFCPDSVNSYPLPISFFSTLFLFWKRWHLSDNCKDSTMTFSHIHRLISNFHFQIFKLLSVTYHPYLHANEAYFCCILTKLLSPSDLFIKNTSWTFSYHNETGNVRRLKTSLFLASAGRCPKAKAEYETV